MLRQIEAALEGLNSSSVKKQDGIKAVLKRYADEEISLDEAYYELLDDELIPMPKRCALSAKIPVTAQDEVNLRERIRGLLAPKL
ncbi:MAG: hypothetical protein ACP5OU_07750 [Methanothrix sp.]